MGRVSLLPVRVRLGCVLDVEVGDDARPLVADEQDVRLHYIEVVQHDVLGGDEYTA